jgi:hypothetical protein
MTFGTPHDVYDPVKGSQLLHGIGQDVVSVATSNLLGRGVLSKTIRDPQKSRPGRTLKISEVYLSVPTLQNLALNISQEPKCPRRINPA